MVLRLGLRNRVWLIWEAGAVALVAMVVFSRVTTTSYPTAWPWITFAAMAIFEEALIPTAGDASHRHRVVLVATVIMFRKHPDVIALVTLAAGLAGGLLARRPWRELLTRTAMFIILAAAGTATLRLVGYADTIHFVLATAALILVYLAATAGLEGLSPKPARWLVTGLASGLIAALVALAWRTPSTGPMMLRLGEVAILAVVGIAIGFALGGYPQGLLHHRLRLRNRPVPVILGAAGLVVSTRLSGQAGAILAAAGLLLLGIFAVQRRWFPVACMLLGGIANELARIANDGRMPVATEGLPAGVGDDLGNLGQTSTYQSVDTNTHLVWLADRFPLLVFPGVASVGDMLIALGIVWIFAALTRASSAGGGVEANVSPMAA
ncbi:MAG: DUF5317 family protein [Candidatus Dormibacter sp.]